MPATPEKAAERCRHLQKSCRELQEAVFFSFLQFPALLSGGAGAIPDPPPKKKRLGTCARAG
eukprot:15437553-Alexandrium_andersonii.AAC.1